MLNVPFEHYLFTSTPCRCQDFFNGQSLSIQTGFSPPSCLVNTTCSDNHPLTAIASGNITSCFYQNLIITQYHVLVLLCFRQSTITSGDTTCGQYAPIVGLSTGTRDHTPQDRCFMYYVCLAPGLVNLSPSCIQTLASVTANVNCPTQPYTLLYSSLVKAHLIITSINYPFCNLCPRYNTITTFYVIWTQVIIK